MYNLQFTMKSRYKNINFLHISKNLYFLVKILILSINIRLLRAFLIDFRTDIRLMLIKIDIFLKEWFKN